MSWRRQRWVVAAFSAGFAAGTVYAFRRSIKLLRLVTSPPADRRSQ